MLVLTRGLKQQIVIGDQQITVTVLEVKGGRVRLGIEAPPDVAVRRKELLEPRQQCLELELATAE
ncbi:MAG: carbon storage regulator [Planctomycetota bacterium]